MYQIFVSHSSKDKKWALFLKQLLSSAKVSVYIAEFDLEPGSKISDNIIKQIRHCNHFILLWSKRSKKSSYVEKEIFLAKSEDKKILPILIQQGIGIPSILGDVKYLDIKNDPDDSFLWLKEYIITSANQKFVSNLVVLALMVFLCWNLIKSE